MLYGPFGVHIFRYRVSQQNFKDKIHSEEVKKEGRLASPGKAIPN